MTNFPSEPDKEASHLRSRLRSGGRNGSINAPSYPSPR